MYKVVVISGGSRGLGQAIVQAFLNKQEYKVATFSRSETSFINSLKDEGAFKGKFLFKSLDISDRLAIEAYIRSVREYFGSVDILINNAGIVRDDVLALQANEDIDKMLNINLRGVIYLTKVCVREMLIQRWGRIINVTSIVGESGYRGLSVYSITKAGLNGFTRSLAREIGGRGITVNSVAPGFLETEMTHSLNERQRQQIIRRTPVGRLGKPEDIVPVIEFLCSDAARFITGQTIAVDGGLTA